MPVTRKIIEIDEELCDGCGNCIVACAEGALEIVDGKAKLVADLYCDGLGACLGDCPTGALQIVERTADEFDEAAVEERLEELKKSDSAASQPAMACGCPSANIQSFGASKACEDANAPTVRPGAGSELTHWPIQIRLVPPTAPFLKNADLLVAADCTAFSHANFQQEFLKDKVLLIGCPKFDDAQSYVDKFSEIFDAAGVRSITTLVMEVPCCSGLPMILRAAMEKAGKTIPMEQVTVSVRGEVLKREKLVA